MVVLLTTNAAQIIIGQQYKILGNTSWNILKSKHVATSPVIFMFATEFSRATPTVRILDRMAA